MTAIEVEKPQDLVTFSDEDRTRFGGDWGLLRTLPEDGIHPETRQRMFGIRSEQRHTGTTTMSRTFLRGDCIYRPMPELEHVMYPHHDDGSQDARDMLDLLVYQAGYAFCRSEEWELSPRMQQFWSVENGQLVQTVKNAPGVYPEKWILMFISKDRFLEWEKRLRQTSDETMGVASTEGQRVATGGNQARTVAGNPDEKQMQDLNMSIERAAIRMDVDLQPETEE